MLPKVPDDYDRVQAKHPAFADGESATLKPIESTASDFDYVMHEDGHADSVFMMTENMVLDPEDYR
jgi:hypothetical protein